MTASRREWTLLLPAMLAALPAQAERKRLPSSVYKFDDLPVKKNGENLGRSVFDGLNRSGVELELHETARAAGQFSHAPHRHQHVEIVMLREGSLEVSIDGNTTILNPGSLAYFASNCLHNAKNIGAGPAQYFVFSIDKDKDPK